VLADETAELAGAVSTRARLAQPGRTDLPADPL